MSHTEDVAMKNCGCHSEYHTDGAIAKLCPLHAAAPELLEALEEAILAMAGMPGIPISQATKQAHAAIKKAKGEV